MKARIKNDTIILVVEEEEAELLGINPASSNVKLDAADAKQLKDTLESILSAVSFGALGRNDPVIKGVRVALTNLAKSTRNRCEP